MLNKIIEYRERKRMLKFMKEWSTHYSAKIANTKRTEEERSALKTVNIMLWDWYSNWLQYN